MLGTCSNAIIKYTILPSKPGNTV